MSELGEVGRGRRIARRPLLVQVGAGASVELDGVAVRTLVLVAPGHEPVILEHDRARAGLLGTRFESSKPGRRYGTSATSPPSASATLRRPSG